MKIDINKIPQKVLDVINTFENKGFQIYIVGGVVRDLLLGRPAYDWDFTTNATPDQILNLFPNAFYDNKYGTVGLEPDLEGNRPFEITTFRKEEGYSDTRHPDKIIWGKTLEEDLSRREATISAIALKIPTKEQKNRATKKHSFELTNLRINESIELIDPYNGQGDLENKIFRAVGDPNERYREDALRMIRAIRISAQLNLSIEENTLIGIKNNSKLIHKIAPERIHDELMKILACPHPYEGMVLLKQTGLMAEILPELEKMFGVEQKSPGRHHVYDVGTHALMALKFCPSTDPIVRFATLIHDVGKAFTYKKLDNGTITFYNHELVSARIAKNIAKRLRFSNSEADKFWRLVRYHQFTTDEKQTDSAIRRFIRNVTPEYVPDMLDLRVGDRLGGGASETSWRLEEYKIRLIEVQKQPFSVTDLKVDGNDVMKILGIKPGPKVGEILNKLFDEVVEKKVDNQKDTLLKKIKFYK